MVSIWAERYDPVTGEFSLVSELTLERYSSTATLLRDGRVLIAGGDNWSDGGGGPLANVDIYDPQTKTTSPGPLMTTPRAYHTATLLKNGKVFHRRRIHRGFVWFGAGPRHHGNF